VAWQNAQNVATNFLCLLHMEMSTLTFTKSRTEELVKKEAECCPVLLLHFVLNLELRARQASSMNQSEAS
jgi:hypothetical protein